jgi:hypothetical protein
MSSQDFGVVVAVSGENIIMRYPVNSSYFSRTKLKIKLEGDDSVFGETTIGSPGTIALTLIKNKAISKNMKTVKE